MNKGLFLFIIFFFSATAFSTTDGQQLHTHSTWHKLIHYKPVLGGRFESESRPGPFFLAQSLGPRSPEAELEATIKSFQESPLSLADEHPACRFPARRLFLEDHLPELKSQLASLKCPGYQAFQDKLQARSLSLVFSSYYLDTPASAFGHTLLRFVKNPDQAGTQRFELLDYAANYAAVVTTDNALLYAVMGMLGGFWGEFAVMPYFYKVREYNDFESRDIWDYELNLTPGQLSWVIAHLWELKQARFPYYYLSHNCSYHILALIDLASPDWQLINRLKPYVLPVDTIRVLAETPGLVKTIHYRPSKRKVLEARLERLSADEQTLLRKSLREKNPALLVDPTNPEQSAYRLDAALDSIDFQNAKEIVQEDPEVLSWKRHFLIARSQLGLRTEDPKFELPKAERPDTGHQTSRLQTMLTQSKRGGLGLTLQHRFALHDFLDPLQGHNPGSSMEMGRFQIRVTPEHEAYGEKTKFWVDDIAVVEVRSLSPLSPFFRKLSWKAYFGGQTLREREHYGKFAPTATVGAGPTVALGEKILISLMAQTSLRYRPEFEKTGFRFDLGPELQLILRLTPKLNWSLSGRYEYYVIDRTGQYQTYYATQARYQLSRNLTLNLDAAAWRFDREAGLGLSFYF